MNNQQILDTLIKGKQRISDPKNWTQGAYARDKFGVECSSGDEAAVCFCALGAIENDVSFIKYREFNKAAQILDQAASEISGWECKTGEYNDYNKHKDVLHLFNVAISIMKKQINEETQL